jgi:hypothetical protein
MFIIFTLFLILFPNNYLFSIDENLKNQVLWPLEMKLPISGSFAEYRNSHLHMGCDFKTYGINGFPVLSVFDGRITSISYSEFGYGLSLVLYSPRLNLYARYAHLNDLKGDIPELDDLKHALRLLGNPNGFSIKVKPEMFMFEGGTKIARSGETGSGVSHLHLELYDNNMYYNPLNFPNYLQADKTPPIIQKLYIDTNTGFSESFTVKKIDEGIYEIDSVDSLILINGKVRIRVSGYDIMTSKNKNNVYKLILSFKEKILFKKLLDKMSYKEASNRDNLYDINHSSLSPTMYVYNMYNQPAGEYSIDLNSYKEGEVIELKAELIDASNNISSLKIPIKVGKSISKKNSIIPKNFSSKDSLVKLDFSGTTISGEGFIEIEQIAKLSEDLSFPGFEQVSDAYEIKATNFSWKGIGKGDFKYSNLKPDEGLYMYDLSLKQWISLNEKKVGPILKFNLTRLGYISIMRDKTPPVINYPYLVYRDFNLPEVRDPNMIERFYAVYDKGSGISNIVNVLLEGSPYPFEFDRDRNFIKIEVPKNFKKYKNFFIIQIQVKDKAGNKSPWFTDVLYL